MASASRRANGSAAVQFNLPGCRRQTLTLGKVSERVLEAVRRHVEELVTAVRTKAEPASATRYWLAEQPDVMVDKLVALGLTKPREAEQLEPTAPTLAEWIDRYIANRGDVKPGTLETYQTVRRNLIAKLGADRRIDTITAGSADDFMGYLKTQTRIVKGKPVKLSKATIKRRCKTAKQIFARAVKDELLPSNPFEYDGVKLASKGNRERFHYVSPVEYDAAIEACPDVEWRALVALARYGGLRCPSETLALRWDDIQWGNNRFVVRSSKTEHHEGGEGRTVPLFPELLIHLREAFERAEPGAVYVITRYRNDRANLRTQFGRILQGAGLKPWAKPWVNLRASRAIELREQFPDHVVNEWLGHCEATASEYYLRVLETHYEAAAGPTALQNALQRRSASGCKVYGESSCDSELQDPAPCCNDSQLVGTGPQGFEP